MGESFLPLHKSKRHKIDESFRYICVYYCIQTGSNYTDDWRKNTKNGMIVVSYFYVTKQEFFPIGVRRSKIFLSETVIDFRAILKAVANKDRQQYRYNGYEYRVNDAYQQENSLNSFFAKQSCLPSMDNEDVFHDCNQ